jgi:predicted DsbA family dithiol-disulfide isomerase
MEAKKTRKIIFTLIIAAVLIFSLVLFLNSQRMLKDQALAPFSEEVASLADAENKQSYVAVNMPVIKENDFVSARREGGLDIIVYEDYSDIFSADLALSLARAQADFSDDVDIAFRPFDVNNSSLSSQSALAVRCAADKEQGMAFRDRLFQAVRNKQLSAEVFSLWAEELGLNKEDFSACLTNLDKKGNIEEVIAAADNFSVYGAPTVFVGEEMLVGARPYESFTDSNGDEIEGLKQVIERQLK